MIRDPETMTSGEIRALQAHLGARIIAAQRRALRPTEHDRATAELRRLRPLKREIDEWE